jgi:hypothetical protein
LIAARAAELDASLMNFARIVALAQMQSELRATARLADADAGQCVGLGDVEGCPQNLLIKLCVCSSIGEQAIVLKGFIPTASDASKTSHEPLVVRFNLSRVAHRRLRVFRHHSQPYSPSRNGSTETL